MPNRFKHYRNREKIFMKIYLYFLDRNPSIRLKEFCFCLLPFLVEGEKSDNSNYTTLKRYLIDYFELDGKMGVHPDAYRKLITRMDSMRIESVKFLLIIRNLESHLLQAWEPPLNCSLRSHLRPA